MGFRRLVFLVLAVSLIVGCSSPLPPEEEVGKEKKADRPKGRTAGTETGTRRAGGGADVVVDIDLAQLRNIAQYLQFLKNNPNHSSAKDVYKELLLELHSGSTRTRIEAADALRQLENPQGRDPLLKLLDDSDIVVAETAGKALVPVADNKVVNILLKLSLDRRTPRRNLALRMLKTIAGERKDLLVEALQHPDARIRLGAARSLVEVKWRAENPGQKAEYFVAMCHWDRASEIGSEALPALLRVVDDQDSGIRTRAVRALGWMRGPKVLRALTGALKDWEITVRLEAARALKNLGKDAKDSLVLATRDQSASVRLAAVRGLGAINDPAVKPVLFGLLSDRALTVRHAAAKILDNRRWIPDGMNDQFRLAIALGRIEQLKDRADRVETLLVKDFDTADLAAGIEAVRLLIRLNRVSATDPIILFLYTRGTRTVAEMCINSSIPKLRKAGIDWAKKHGFRAHKRPRPGREDWRGLGP